MIGFKQFVMTAQKTKKCPEGYRFSKKLGVCVPIGQRTYYPFFGKRTTKSILKSLTQIWRQWHNCRGHTKKFKTLKI